MVPVSDAYLGPRYWLIDIPSVRAATPKVPAKSGVALCDYGFWPEVLTGKAHRCDPDVVVLLASLRLGPLVHQSG